MGKPTYREVTSLMGSEACVLSTTAYSFESWLTFTESKQITQVLSPPLQNTAIASIVLML